MAVSARIDFELRSPGTKSHIKSNLAAKHVTVGKVLLGVGQFISIHGLERILRTTGLTTKRAIEDNVTTYIAKRWLESFEPGQFIINAKNIKRDIDMMD